MFGLSLIFFRIPVTLTRGVLVSVNFGGFSPTRFSHFHCNAMGKAIKAHKNMPHKSAKRAHP